MKKKIVKPRKKQEVIIHGKEKKQETKGEVLEQSAPVQEQKPEPRQYVEKKEKSDEEHIAESRKALDSPLPPGQQFFESPEGEILIGESDKTHMWSRRMNGGKGGWINPRR